MDIKKPDIKKELEKKLKECHDKAKKVNGILTCSICGEALETVETPDGKKFAFMRPPRSCACTRELEEAVRKADEEARSRNEANENRRICFSGEAKLMESKFENDAGYNQEFLKVAERYAENFADKFLPDAAGLIFYGKPGAGKTFASAAICNRLIDSGCKCRFVTAAEIGEEMRKDRTAAVGELKRFALLVIDELNLDVMTDYRLEQIADLINARYTSGLPIIATTNMSPSEIKDKSNQTRIRIFDRLLENCHPVEAAGNNIRHIICRNGFEERKKILGL